MSIRLLGRFSLRAKFFGALLLLAGAAGASSAYVAHHFLAVDAAYSRLIESEAAGVMLIGRAGIYLVEDGRLVLAQLLEPSFAGRARIARERVAAQERVHDALARTAAALPAQARQIAAFSERFQKIAAAGDRVAVALSEGDGERAKVLAYDVHKPDFAKLRAELHELVGGLDTRLRSEGDRLTARAEASAARTLAITGGASLAALLLLTLLSMLRLISSEVLAEKSPDRLVSTLGR